MDEEKRLYYLDQMGVQAWIPNISELENNEKPISTDNSESIQKAEYVQLYQSPISEMQLNNLEELKRQVSKCELCELHRTRTQTVFGVGHPAADWLIIGEAPGADEDRKGEPFVGRAGQLLTNMLRAIGLAREEVFIANILKCRPPNNRDPKQEEIDKCRQYLRQQIELIKPKIILAVGRIAAQALLNTDTPIGRLRGKRFTFEDTEIPLVATYHPAYLLRSPQQKRKAWEDLKFALEIKDLC